MDEADEQERKTPFVITVKDGELTANIHRIYNLIEASRGHGRGTSGILVPADDSTSDTDYQTSPLPNQFIIISVVGPPSSGKSFLINWVARYLSANGDDEWMASTGGDKLPLRGFNWSPFPDDLDLDEDIHSGALAGVRMLADLPKLYHVTMADDGSKRVTKHAKVILLDVDIPDKADPEFKKYSTALAASCMLVSTLTIFIDGGCSRGIAKKIQDLYNPRLLMALLDQSFSEADSRIPEILLMTNQHFPHPGTVGSTHEFKQFCNAYNVAFTEHTFHTLSNRNRPGNFQGALEHMNKPQLHLALSRMACVEVLLSKCVLTPPDIYILFQNVVRRINETLKPDVWVDFSLNQYISEVSIVAGGQSESDTTAGVSVQCNESEEIPKIPTAAPRHSLNLLQHRDSGMSLPAWSNTKPPPVPEDSPQSIRTSSNISDLRRVEQQARGAPGETQAHPAFTANANEVQEQLDQKINASTEEVNRIHNPAPESKGHQEGDGVECKITRDEGDEQACEKIGNEEASTGDSDQDEYTDMEPNLHPPPVEAANDTIDDPTISEIETSTTVKQDESRRNVELHVEKHCMAEFDWLLANYLPYFMASSMIRLDVATLIGVNVIDQHFQGRNLPFKEHAANHFERLFNGRLEELSYITEAIDRGRNLIESEFESEVHFTGEEIGKLVARARKFSSGGFKPQSAEHSKFFEACWTAMEQNAKFRNERVCEHEKALNEQAISSVLGLYSAEVLQFLSATEADVHCTDPRTRMAGMNDALVGDCIKALAGVKKYRAEAENAKAELVHRMTEFYLHKIVPHIDAIEKRIQQESEMKRRQEYEVEQRDRGTAHMTTTSEPANDVAHRGPQIQQSGTTNLPALKRPFTTPPLNPTTSARARSATERENTRSDAHAGVSVPPLIKEKIPDLSTLLPPASLPPVTSNSAKVPDTNILVVHLGRDSTVRVAPVGNIAKQHGIQKIPACIAAIEGDFIIGEHAQKMATSLSFQDMSPGPHRYTMLVGKKPHQLRYELLLGLFLAKCREKMEDETGQLFKVCLLVIPALRSTIEREAIRDAGLVAGFESVRLISELTAVAFDYHSLLQTKETRVTRSTSCRRVMVLYFAKNGEKEMALHEFSQAETNVTMLAVTGTRLLPKLSPGWGRRSSEYEKYAADIAEASHISLYYEDAKLILAGDDHGLVQQSAAKVDILKSQGHSITRLADECAIYGAVALAEKMALGQEISSFVTEKLGIPIKIRLPDGYSAKSKLIIERNTDMQTQTSFSLSVTDRSQDWVTIQLLNKKLGIPMGAYTIEMQYPPEFPRKSFTYVVTYDFTISHNGVMQVKAHFIARGPQGTKYYPLKVYRSDLFNLSREDIDKYRKFVTKYVPSSPEEKAKRQVRKELLECLEHLRDEVQVLKNKGGSYYQVKWLEGEIHSTTRTLEDSSTDLETLRLLKLTLQRLSPPTQHSTNSTPS